MKKYENQKPIYSFHCKFYLSLASHGIAINFAFQQVFSFCKVLNQIFVFRTLIDSSEHQIFVSTSRDQLESISESSVRVDPRKNNPASVLTESQQIKTIPEKVSSANEINFETRLSKSPVQFSTSEARPISSPPSKPVSSLQIAEPVLSPRSKLDDADARSISSYSMEFEEEDQEYVQVNFYTAKNMT